MTHTRREVLGGAAAIAVTAGTLAACAPSASGPGSGGGGGPVTVPVTDIPVGSGTITNSVVVTQPTAGEFKAFSAICTHQNCLVTRIERDRVHCTCHGSIFSTVDGSVVQGPATRALSARTVTVDGDTVTVT